MRKLTPFESELRSEAPRSFGPPRRRGPWSRFLTWRRRRRPQPPRTLRGAIFVGLVRLAVALAAGSGVAALVVRWFDKSWVVAFYAVGAFVLATAVFFSAADTESPNYYNSSEREYRVRASFSYVLVGTLLLGIGLVLETR